VPFPDELGPLEVVPYSDTWVNDFDALAGLLRGLDLASPSAVDHIGSTSVPGLAAKDVIDVQIRVGVLDAAIAEQFKRAGFRRRDEPWNKIEATRDGPIPKLVFAPARGHRRANIHVRVDGSAGARDSLLFRDFLRATPTMCDAWADFKLSIVRVAPQVTLGAYGQIKQPAWLVLMHAADIWAESTGWSPAALPVPPTPLAG